MKEQTSFFLISLLYEVTSYFPFCRYRSLLCYTSNIIKIETFNLKITGLSWYRRSNRYGNDCMGLYVYMHTLGVFMLYRIWVI